MRVFYTGTIITPDGSDTNVYGEGCEPGMGARMESGWIDPDWTLWEVNEERESVCADEWSADSGSMIEWLVSTIIGRLGYVEDNGDGTFYASHEVNDYRTGATVMLAAHVKDCPDAVLSAVSYSLAYIQRRK